MNRQPETPGIMFDIENRYGDLTHDLPAMVFSMDAALKFSSFNHACEIFMGRTGRDLIGKTMEEAFPDVAPLFGVECREVLETRLSKAFPATTVSNGHSMVFNVHIYPIHHGVAVFLSDLTREINLELDEIDIVEHLPIPGTELRKFVNAISRDDQGPMAALLSLMSLSTIHPESNIDGRNLLQRVASVVARLNPEHAASPVAEHKEYVAFKTELKRVKKSLANEISESKAFITCDFQVPGIITLKTQLYTIMYSLVVAGIKSRAKGIMPMVHLQTNETNESLFFSVTVKGLLSNSRTTVSADDSSVAEKKVDDNADIKKIRKQAEVLGAALDVQRHVNGRTVTLIFPKIKS